MKWSDFRDLLSARLCENPHQNFLFQKSFQIKSGSLKALQSVPNVMQFSLSSVPMRKWIFSLSMKREKIISDKEKEFVLIGFLAFQFRISTEEGRCSIEKKTNSRNLISTMQIFLIIIEPSIVEVGIESPPDKHLNSVEPTSSIKSIFHTRESLQKSKKFILDELKHSTSSSGSSFWRIEYFHLQRRQERVIFIKRLLRWDSKQAKQRRVAAIQWT